MGERDLLWNWVKEHSDFILLTLSIIKSLNERGCISDSGLWKFQQIKKSSVSLADADTSNSLGGGPIHPLSVILVMRVDLDLLSGIRAPEVSGGGSGLGRCLEVQEREFQVPRNSATWSCICPGTCEQAISALKNPRFACPPPVSCALAAKGP